MEPPAPPSTNTKRPRGTGQSPKKRHWSIAVCTPWRDHQELAPDYFTAIESSPPDQLIIVDDGSEEPLPFAHERIERSGFCGASNKALELAETDAVLFLNNDIAPFRHGWLEDIRKQIQPGVVLGMLCYLHHGDVDGVNYPYVDGWCLAMTTEDARLIGGWDERYDEAGPAYFSDNALSFQARLKGMTLRELRPGVRHKGGQTGGGWASGAIGPNKELWESQVREAKEKARQ